ncbi:hypothetical protein [Flammeovirga sp. SJP92]|uniref:hypothetical protein n=1 Tax=Flammeovirga sp. SJP92 TaxID=1775430 RepID=UPI00078969F8|nr:hypothetical protein [Flammeovirga sp. SJP92]KXX68972.1 hypothetical protein AVL50_17580 [Flammeovirga sp. SJP92]
MKFPVTPLDVKNEIELTIEKQKPVQSLRTSQLIKVLKKVPEEIIVEGVIMTIEDKNNGFCQQEIASKILSSINPKSLLDIKNVIDRIIDNWDKSCEEIVYWLVENYGLEVVNSYLSTYQIIKHKSIKPTS